jgi:uncharacterized membrane protein YphA (DoxX/SURF4 family)
MVSESLNKEMHKVKNLFSEIIGWALLIIILISGFLISRYEGWNLIFTLFLIAEIILVIIFINSFSKLNITISRIILGCLFIFSGFVKGVDPIGTQYRIEDYFIAFGMDWAIPFAFLLSVILNATEFVLGTLLLLNINIRITSWLVVVMMSVFTALTLNDATNNPVPDCGCFGDALLISNWQTFYKNLVIDALLLMVFLTRKRIPGWFNFRVEWALLIVTIFGFVYFEMFNFRHLPVVDFMDWKVGKKMINDNPLPSEYFLTYRNKQTGELKEYLSPDYPYNDSVWMAQWEFESQRVVDPNPPIHNLRVEDEWGNDKTSSIISNPEFQFVLVSYDLAKANVKKLHHLTDLIQKCNLSGISFVTITASLPEDAARFKEINGLETEFYFADDVILKSMVRSNPGLLLLKNGVVLRKWHFNDFPTVKEVRDKFPDLIN